MDQLLKDQTLIQQKLRRLESMMNASERAAELAQRAEQSASEAREAIFNDANKEAVADQGKVIGALAELQKELENKVAGIDDNLSAKQYEKLAEKLGETKKQLEAAHQKHQEAEKQAGTERANAAKNEAQASRDLAKAANTAELPQTVASRIRSAQDATAEASRALSNKNADADKALDNADRAIRQAIGEVNEAMETAKRNALAVKLGELNRATESLARASAKARDTADLLEANKPVPADSKTELGKVEEIAKKVAEGVKDLAPEATGDLNEAAKDAAKSAGELPEGEVGDEPKQVEAKKAESAAQAANAAWLITS